MRPILHLTLGLNLLFAQAAVARDSWFGVDKIKHFFLSAFVTSVSYSAIQAAGANRKTAMTGAVGASLAVGVAREVYNRRTTKLFSFKDLAWDAAGTAAAAAMLNQTRK
jgi:putative lipoprotein